MEQSLKNVGASTVKAEGAASNRSKDRNLLGMFEEQRKKARIDRKGE